MMTYEWLKKRIININKISEKEKREKLISMNIKLNLNSS